MDNVIGHDWAVAWLRQALRGGQVRHAYCFTGPAAIGKRTLAMAFARALLCTAGEGAARPCGTCPACLKTAGGYHPDLRIVAPAAEAAGISVEQVRTGVVHEAALSPLEAAIKVFLIEDMHLATVAASNALLKTLEEPPASAVLLLISDQREALLPTIASRCQIINLRPVGQSLIAQTLHARGHVTPARAALLARLSDGRLGYAIQMAQDGATWERRGRQLDELTSLLSASRVQRLAYAGTMATQRDQVNDTLFTWQSWWRDVWLCRVGAADRAVNVDRLADLAAYARRWPLDQIQFTLQAVTRTAQLIGRNVNVRLALEVLLLRMPHADPVERAL